MDSANFYGYKEIVLPGALQLLWGPHSRAVFVERCSSALSNSINKVVVHLLRRCPTPPPTHTPTPPHTHTLGAVPEPCLNGGWGGAQNGGGRQPANRGRDQRGHTASFLPDLLARLPLCALPPPSPSSPHYSLRRLALPSGPCDSAECPAVLAPQTMRGWQWASRPPLPVCRASCRRTG